MSPYSLINDDFWSPRINIVSQNTLPSMYNQLKQTGRWDFFNFSAENVIPHIFWDSDIAKFLEAVCLALKYTKPGDKYNLLYREWIDNVTNMAIKAQRPDGYLNTYFIQMCPEDVLKNVMEKHELYCAGHLIEAAVAHYDATGSMDLINCVCGYVDFIANVFGDGDDQLHGYPGHQEIELALVKLLKIVPKRKYFDLLDYFVEQRGYKNGEFFDDQLLERGIDPHSYNPPLGDDIPGYTWPQPRSYWYYQAELPIREVTEAKGHAVRQTYYLTAVQALANLKGDKSLSDAVYRIFRNIVDKKLYIHGGIGSEGRWEGFGEDYELRWDGYSETCASIGLVLMCEKMLLNELDAEVACVMEKALYNDVLGGVSLEGESYFYDQPITGIGGLKRQSWFSCSCCPPNVARLFSSLDKYAFSLKQDSIAVHLFIGADIKERDYSCSFRTQYPFSGTFDADIKSDIPISVSIRCPKGKFSCSNTNYTLSNGYLIFETKIWNESLSFKFDIPIEIIRPDPNVEANKGCVAVQRGPFVYALENSGIQGDISLDNVVITKKPKFIENIEQLYEAKYISLTTKIKDVKCVLVPYFVTGNKNPGEDFRIWLKKSSKSNCSLQ